MTLARHVTNIFFARQLRPAGKQQKISAFDGGICVSKKVRTRCRSPPCKRFLVGCSSTFMRLAEHLTALASRVAQVNVCLVGENTTCSVPALQEHEGLWS